MKIKITTFCFLFAFISYNKVYSQEENLKNVEYKIIAEGTDSPIQELQVVCNNKYFNIDYLPKDFVEKHNLEDKTLYNKKMLIEIFHTDKKQNGMDKIELIGIKENDQKLIIEYNLVNANSENDNEVLSPFLIIQIPRMKKEIKFIVNGVELGKADKLYLN